MSFIVLMRAKVMELVFPLKIVKVKSSRVSFGFEAQKKLK